MAPAHSTMRKQLIDDCAELDEAVKAMNEVMPIVQAALKKVTDLAPGKEKLTVMDESTDMCVLGRDRSVRDVANSVDARDEASIAKEKEMLRERLRLLTVNAGPASLSKSANTQIKKFQKSLQQMLGHVTELNGTALTMREVAVHANVASISEITAIFTQLNALDRIQIVLEQGAADQMATTSDLTAAQESEAAVRQELSDIRELRQTDAKDFGVLLAAHTAELADAREEKLRLQRELADKERELANSFSAKARKALGAITNIVPRLSLV